jgi:hypothetical protein
MRDRESEQPAPALFDAQYLRRLELSSALILLAVALGLGVTFAIVDWGGFWADLSAGAILFAVVWRRGRRRRRRRPPAREQSQK